MKHVPDPNQWQHESSFVCEVCRKRINFNSLFEPDGPDDCPGQKERAPRDDKDELA